MGEGGGSVFASLDLGAPTASTSTAAALPQSLRRLGAANVIPTRLPLSLTVTQRTSAAADASPERTVRRKAFRVGSVSV